MACVHNCFMRAFNGIYHHAAVVPPAEYHSFVSYAYNCYAGLHAHHEGEENFAFPALEEATGEKGLMDVNVHQHEAFHDGLAEFASYLEGLLKGDVSQFSGTKLRSILDSFAPALNQHLHDEIPTLLGLAKYGDKLDLKGLLEKEAQLVMGSLSKTKVIPAFLLNHDVAYEGGLHASFPSIPAPVKWIFMHVLTLFHYSWWKYAACDFSGNLKVAKSEKA
jgi:hemerythrin-like domain-containing protein